MTSRRSATGAAPRGAACRREPAAPSAAPHSPQNFARRRVRRCRTTGRRARAARRTRRRTSGPGSFAAPQDWQSDEATRPTFSDRPARSRQVRSRRGRDPQARRGRRRRRGERARAQGASRAWWRRVPRVLDAPRAVFVALRGDRRGRRGCASEPILAIVIARGDGRRPPHAGLGHVLDDAPRRARARRRHVHRRAVLRRRRLFLLGLVRLARRAQRRRPRDAVRHARQLVAFAALPIALSLLVVVPASRSASAATIPRRAASDEGAGRRIGGGRRRPRVRRVVRRAARRCSGPRDDLGAAAPGRGVAGGRCACSPRPIVRPAFARPARGALSQACVVRVVALDASASNAASSSSAIA